MFVCVVNRIRQLAEITRSRERARVVAAEVGTILDKDYGEWARLAGPPSVIVKRRARPRRGTEESRARRGERQPSRR